MCRNITLALAIVTTVSGSDIALSNCANSFGASDPFTEGLSSGVVGDQFDPTTSFAESKALDPQTS